MSIKTLRNSKRALKYIMQYCCKAEQCFKVIKIPLNIEAQEYVPEDGVDFFDVKPICNYLFKDDDKYWDELDANRLIAESVGEYCLA